MVSTGVVTTRAPVTLAARNKPHAPERLALLAVVACQLLLADGEERRQATAAIATHAARLGAQHL